MVAIAEKFGSALGNTKSYPVVRRRSADVSSDEIGPGVIGSTPRQEPNPPQEGTFRRTLV
jgi:hypothetical protein